MHQNKCCAAADGKTSFLKPQGTSSSLSKDSSSFSLKQGWRSSYATCVCEQKHLISWLEREHKEEGMNEPARSVSSVPRLFADETLAFIFCFKREESMAMPAEHEVLVPRQLFPLFLKTFPSWILGRCNYCAVNL